jgi:hypothetical protein
MDVAIVLYYCVIISPSGSKNREFEFMQMVYVDRILSSFETVLEAPNRSIVSTIQNNTRVIIGRTRGGPIRKGKRDVQCCYICSICKHIVRMLRILEVLNKKL